MDIKVPLTFTTGEPNEYIEKSVVVRNARNHKVSLDKEGFTLINQTSKVTNFYSDENLLTSEAPQPGQYTLEVEQYIKQTTNAKRVIVYDHKRRTTSRDIRNSYNRVMAPAPYVHCDYTLESAQTRLQYCISLFPEEDKSSFAGDFEILQTWRTVAGDVLRRPLAICDRTSIAKEDLLPIYRDWEDVYTDRLFRWKPVKDITQIDTLELNNIKGATIMTLGFYNPNQRWYYFPAMQANEVLIFKSYDSIKGGFVMHGAINDPNTLKNDPQRESIESRCVVLY